MAVVDPVRGNADAAAVVPDVPVPCAPKTVVLREVQALRALAVALVVVYHYWPHLISGGYIGVDVFFVISGFLITSHLLREVTRTGRVSLPEFYARRARRILPAALLVLLVCALVTVLFVSQDRWAQFLAEIRASTFYYENWYLAHASVDYLAAQNLPSPVQHYWSLSVEEQFYLVWPLVLLGGVLATRGGWRHWRRRVVGVLLGLLTAGSFVWSVHQTAVDPAPAFFVTPTRVWEFGIGALLALLVPASASHLGAVRALASWAGLLTIAVAALLYTPATPFPGVAALAPVLGAGMVIWAGASSVRWSPLAGMSWRPVQWLGNVSYSLYLWHWPLLILTPLVIGAPLGGPAKLGLVVAAVLAAWATKKLVEDPVRTGQVLAARGPAWTLAGALAASGLVLLVVVQGNAMLQVALNGSRAQTARVVAARPRCFGASAFHGAYACRNPKLARTAVPTPVEAAATGNAPCRVIDKNRLRPVCVFSDPHGPAAGTIAVIGDSHADDFIFLTEVDALDTLGVAAHRSCIGFAEADGHAVPGGEDDFIPLGKIAQRPPGHLFADAK